MGRLGVLYVMPSAKAGGVPMVTCSLLRHLDQARFQPEVLVPEDGPFYENLSRLAPTHPLPIRGFHPGTLRRLRRLLREGRFQIVHALGRGAGLYARLAALGSPVKVVYSYRGFHFRHYAAPKAAAYLALERLLLSRTDAVVCVSRGEMNEAIAAGVLTPAKALLIPNGVEFYEPQDSTRRKEAPTIGTLSRISVQKGLEYLLPAVASLRERFPGLRCLIAGGAQPEERSRERRLRELVSRQGLQDSILFVGEVGDPRAFLGELDIYVSASLWEGLPTAVLEAFACRVPVVATNVTGNNELVVDGRTGVLVPPRDSEALAEGVGKLLREPELGRGLASQAYELARSGYSPERMTRAYEDLYVELAGNDHAR